MEHVNIPAGEIHSPHNWEFADSVARLASVQADATLIGRVAIQLSDHTTWRLASVSPAVWSQIDATMPTDLDSIQFDTTPEAVPTTTGALFWDNADGNKTLSLVMDGATGTTQQIGEETYYRVKASSAITEGQAVMVTGSVGASGVLTAARATDLTYDNPYRILGVATENIAANAFGFVTAFGMVRGFNTTGASVGETWADGDALYYSPVNSGSLTNIPPQAPVAKALIAHVVHAGTSGSVFVRPVLGSAFGSTDGNVKFTALSDNNFIVYNAATGLWENRTPAAVKTTLNLGNVDNTSDADKPVSTATAAALGVHTGNTSNPHSVTKAQVGLGNVDNTSDADKPVSTATAAALASKEATANKGAPSGYASLDAGGKVPAAQLPSFVDDVIEVDTLPVTGESGKIYVTLADGKTWRWGGTAYAEISASPGSTDAVPEGVSNLYHTAARVRDAVLTGLSTASSAVVTAADSVLTAFGKLQAQLALKLNAANPSYTGGLTGDTGVVNLGSGQFVKDAAGNVTLGAGAYKIAGAVSAPTWDTNTALWQEAGFGARYDGYQHRWDVGDSRTLGAVLTNAGNFGLGVTPSAWSVYKAIEVPGGAFVGTPGESGLFLNTYFDGAYRYKASGISASRFDQFNGAFRWFTAPSGTAGNPITFTQAMTLDAASKLELLGGGVGGGATQTLLQLRSASDASSNSVEMMFSPLISGQTKTAIGAAREGATANAALYFTTGGIERARIDASGSLLVGTTVASAKVTVNNGSAVQFTGSWENNNAGTQYFHSFSYNGTEIGSIKGSNTSTAFLTTSDHRLKTNVRPADARRFMDIEFVDFEWLDGRHDCGLIAHQLQSVYPDLVYGEKDATEEVEYEASPATPAVLDDEGNEVAPAVEAVMGTKTQPKYQQVNYMGLTSRMGTVVQRHERTIAALQAQIDTQNTAMQLLVARLEALEAK